MTLDSDQGKEREEDREKHGAEDYYAGRDNSTAGSATVVACRRNHHLHYPELGETKEALDVVHMLGHADYRRMSFRTAGCAKTLQPAEPRNRVVLDRKNLDHNYMNFLDSPPEHEATLGPGCETGTCVKEDNLDSDNLILEQEHMPIHLFPDVMSIQDRSIRRVDIWANLN